MRKKRFNWANLADANPTLTLLGILAVITGVIMIGMYLTILSCRNCEIEPACYNEITNWAEGGWTAAYPKLKKAIEEANSDGKISKCEFDDLKALRERCGYEDARSYMMRTIENPPKQGEKKNESKTD